MNNWFMIAWNTTLWILFIWMDWTKPLILFCLWLVWPKERDDNDLEKGEIQEFNSSSQKIN